MERAMQVEERIRRAEEIYNNRRMQNNVRVSANDNKNKKKITLLRKVFFQIIICLLIYFIFYLIKNSNYIFSESIIAQTKNFLSYDINFEELYLNAGKYYNENIKILFENKIENIEKNNEEDSNQERNINDEIESETKQTNEIDLTAEEKANISNNDMGIGGGEDEIVKETSSDEEELVELSQMEIDANDIKNNYSLIIPLYGIISSRFGPRTPTNIISANHAGIDIAANEGTVFYASMEGTVTYVSTEGGYGNHFWIQNDDVITLYAHCSQIYVNEGDYINQGEEIGEVGQTGNATGPHLHFEIRKDNRVVNPELILEF